jgi:uncharacterized protein (DUF433 family)
MTATLSRKFQISMPKAILEAQHWQAGQEFVFVPKGKGVLVMPVPELDQLAGIAKGARKDGYRDRTDRHFVTVDPEIQSGAPVFTGTRVPVKNLFDYLEEGDSLDTFLDQFPTVTREMAVAVLEDARAQQRRVLDLVGTLDWDASVDLKRERSRE